MNTTTEPRQCPACSAAIPVDAPHGLCPKCLLLGIASTAEPPSESGGFDPNSAATSPPTALRPQEEAARDNRLNPPSIEDLNAAFPQLEIIELIGRGGMGFVYKARQTKLDRYVALKILPGHLAREPSFHERFEREARVLAKLQHPLIVSVHDFGEAATDDGAHFFYLMLEYVDGVNLREAMRAGRFTPDQALAIVPQVCEALQYAHSKGVLHRDIKPENILLDTDGRVKIADFGIAKVLGPEIDSSSQFVMSGASESEMAVTRLTATGSVLGTPLYMAPEQLINPNSVDHRADIFSLGVVFYEMLTGELPMGRFAAPSEKSLANQQIDQRIDEVVLRALAKEKELRQQSAGEMKTEVETISSTPRPSPVPPPVPGATAAHRRPDSSDATGSGKPSVNAKQAANRIFSDLIRSLLAVFVVSFLSGAIPLVLVIVTSPIWLLDLIVFGVVEDALEPILRSSIGFYGAAFAGVVLCIAIDSALLYVIWRRWLRHFSPRRAGASLRWLVTPFVEEERHRFQETKAWLFPRSVEEQRRSESPSQSSASSSSATGASGAAIVGIKSPLNSTDSVMPTPSGGSTQPPVTPEFVAHQGNTSGSGGWWALASLFIGTPLAMTPMVGFTVRVASTTPPPPPSPAWVALAVALSLLFLVGGTLGPIWLGWRHLIHQHRDHSRNGIIPAMIAAWFLPLLILDVVLYLGFDAQLDRYVDWQLFSRYFAGLLYLIVDGVIFYSTWCWVSHSPFNVPTGLKSARLWYPLGWTVLSAFVGWGAFEAVQSYGRYTFMRIDESVEMLEAKSGGYFVRGNVWSHTVVQGNRAEPTPDRAYWGMTFIRQSDTKRSGSSVEVALPDLTIRRSHTVPNDVPLTEENLLAQMKLAGIDTNRLGVAVEARSLIETAHELANALLNQSRFPLVNHIDPNHWNVTTRPRLVGTVRHGWDVTHRTASGSLSIKVNQDDALRAMAAVVTFWLVGLAILLGLLPTRETRFVHETEMNASESPWPRRAFRVVASLAGLSVVVTVVTFLPVVVKLATQSPPAVQPPHITEAPIAGTARVATAVAPTVITAHAAGVARTNPTPPQALSAAETEAKRLGLILVVDETSTVYTFQQPIELRGDAGDVLVEPHFSALVRFPAPTTNLSFTFKGTATQRQSRAFIPDYPCDYIACDWTAGTDKPRIMGYMLPPGAYDFRADAETTQLLNEMDSTKRAKIAADTLTIIRAAALKSAATESDWQQGTQAAHVRFKLVPKAISKLSVPDECLVVLTEKSKSLFTRSGGNFSKHEFVTDANIDGLRESLTPSKGIDKKVEVQEPPESDQGAARQQNEKERMPKRAPLDPPDEGPLDATLPENASRLEP